MRLSTQFLAALLAGLALLLSACSEDESTPTAPRLQGRVLDAEGQPVDHAPILLRYELPYPTGEADTMLANAAEASALVWYSLPAATPLLITVHDLESVERLATLRDEDAPAGLDSLLWDLRDDDGVLLPADCYLILLTVPGDQFGFVILSNPDYRSLEHPWEQLGESQSDGGFQLFDHHLAFRHQRTFNLVNRVGYDIGDWDLDERVRVEVLAEVEGRLLSSGWLDVDSPAALDITLQAAESSSSAGLPEPLAGSR